MGMSILANRTHGVRELVDRLFNEVLNQQRLGIIDELFAGNFILYTGHQPVMGPAELRKFIAHFIQAFPDIQHAIEDLVFEGDKVVVRWCGHGTQRETFFGIDATNRPMSYTGIIVLRVHDGRFVEGWISADLLGLLLCLTDVQGVLTCSLP